jgi:2-oxo-4-hydroxy-4-carboxy--5-ureidoimidazoline (OHCU) decarboxylase
LKAFEKRLKNDVLHEQREAIKQINRIAWHRLNDIIQKETHHHGWKN